MNGAPGGVTIAAAALGVGVLGVLVVGDLGAVRDHVEGWHFQFTCVVIHDEGPTR